MVQEMEGEKERLAMRVEEKRHMSMNGTETAKQREERDNIMMPEEVSMVGKQRTRSISRPAAARAKDIHFARHPPRKKMSESSASVNN